MHMTPDMLHYFQQFYGYLQHQNRKMEEMNAMIQQMQKDITQLKENKNQPVINNEYKFDLLKVEKLEGTLNIGLNPNGSDATIDEFSVSQSPQVPPVENRYPALFHSVQNHVHQYLNQGAYKSLKSLERKYNYPLDDTYRKFIMDDVKKQIDGRIRHYLNENGQEGLRAEEMDELGRSLCEKVKADIDKTLEAFIKNLPRKEADT